MSVEMDTEQEWTIRASALLLKRKIVAVRYISQDEADAFGWSRRSVAFRLDNGVWVFASSDDEGNEAGALFTTDKDTGTLPVIV